MKEVICEIIPGLTLNGEILSEFYHPVDNLVRCKDCKRYIEQAHECEALNQGCIKPDFFCGYGERKDGGGE